MLCYLVDDHTATSKHVSVCYNIFFFIFVYTQKIFYVKKIIFFNANVLKTHFDCLNSQINNFENMERDRHKAIFRKN